LAHRSHGLSSRKISAALLQTGMIASKTTVAKVLRENSWEQQGIEMPARRLGPQCLPSVRSKGNIQKVKKLVNLPDPYTHSSISRQLGLSETTVRRIIKRDLDGKVRSKSKTHALSDKMVEQRVRKGPRLLKRLQGKRLENVVSIDEAWCYMSYVNGRRKIYCQFRGRQSPRSFLKYWREKHPKGVMFVAGISYKGTTDIRFVPPRAKVNSDFYINKVVHPLFKKDIPRLFGKQAKMAVLHRDSAPAHKSAKTVAWLKSNGYKFIPEEDWPANSPDLSPMDYSINGIFKQRLWRRKTKSLEGLKRAMREEWKKIDIGLCRRTMKGWAPRVEKMLENKGYQFQHLRNLQKNVF